MMRAVTRACGACCGEDCWGGCGEVFIPAGSCPQREWPGCPASDVVVIGVSLAWSGFIRHPPGTVPTNEQLLERVTFYFEGRCYTTSRHVFCPADYAPFGEGARIVAYSTGGGRPGCPPLPPAGMRLVRGDTLQIIEQGCADERCFAGPGVTAYVPCGGPPGPSVVYLCNNQAGAAKVVALFSRDGLDLGCWCRTGESTLPAGAVVFDGFVVGTAEACCQCMAGCQWDDDGTPGGCCCGKIDRASVVVNGTLFVHQRTDFGGGEYNDATYSYLAETIGQIPGAAANSPARARVRITVVQYGTTVRRGQPPTTYNITDISEVEVAGFCGPPCPVGFFGLFSFPLKVTPNFGGAGCPSASGSETVAIPGGTNRASWTIQRQCGLSSINASGTETGYVDEAGGNLNTVSSEWNGQASIAMRYDLTGCNGQCVGVGVRVETLEGMLP